MEDGTLGDIGKEEKKERVEMPELEDVEKVMESARNADVMDGDTAEIVPEEEEVTDWEEPPVEELFPEGDDESNTDQEAS